MKQFYKRHKYLCWITGILFTAWVTYGFIRAAQEADIEKLEYNVNNPVSVVFPISGGEMQDRIKRWDKQMDHFLFKGYILYTSPEYSNSFQLKYGNTSSYIYRYRPSKVNIGREVMQRYTYEVQIYPVGTDSTIVTVYLIDNYIISGVRIWGNPQFTRYIQRITSVSSSSIEECELLRYIAKKLGYLHLIPPVQYPKQLTREQILKTFGNKNPFTLEEMWTSSKL